MTSKYHMNWKSLLNLFFKFIPRVVQFHEYKFCQFFVFCAHQLSKQYIQLNQWLNNNITAHSYFVRMYGQTCLSVHLLHFGYGHQLMHTYWLPITALPNNHVQGWEQCPYVTSLSFFPFHYFKFYGIYISVL